MILPNSHEETQTTNSKKQNTQVNEGSHTEEMSGDLGRQSDKDKLMHSVLENDKDTIDDGKLLSESINQGLGSFTPDLMFEQMVKNYSMAKNLYGETLIRALSGYDPDYVQKNIKIPEFARELQKNIKDKIERMKKDKLIDKNGVLTDDGLELASLVTAIEELDTLESKGLIGERKSKKKSHYGISEEVRDYKKGDRYRDIAIKKTVKTVLRRGHDKILRNDLKVFDRESKSQIYLIYAIDASGSMKGSKISTSKKAGIALCYKAIEEKDKVGLIVFGDEVKEKVLPTTDFMEIVKKIISVKASSETNIAQTIKESVLMFPKGDVTKHLLLLTDALPTTGKDPQKEVLDEVAIAVNHGITISVIGINLDKKGKGLAEKITQLSKGKLYVIKDVEELDRIVLEDYYNL